MFYKGKFRYVHPEGKKISGNLFEKYFMSHMDENGILFRELSQPRKDYFIMEIMDSNSIKLAKKTLINFRSRITVVITIRTITLLTAIIFNGCAVMDKPEQRDHSNSAPSNQDGKLATKHPPQAVSPKELALKQCLLDNYEKAANINIKQFNDSSPVHDFTPDTDMSRIEAFGELFDFVEKNTQHFYQEELPSLYSESFRNPHHYNAIFSRCMEFYKSKELANFIETKGL